MKISRFNNHIRQYEAPAYTTFSKEGGHLSFIILILYQSMTQFKIAFDLHIKLVLFYLIRILLPVIIYMLSARLGLMKAYFQTNTSPLCTPTGIGLAALLIHCYRNCSGLPSVDLLGCLTRESSSSYAGRLVKPLYHFQRNNITSLLINDEVL